MLPLAWHFDFHSHKSVRIGHAPDFQGVAAALAEAEVEEVITFAKCHTGFSYYPTRVATPHPLMKCDVFGGMLNACRSKGIKVIAYVSFGIDGEAGRAHPEWAKVGPEGPYPWPSDGFIRVCPYTGYMDTLMMPQVDEIIRLYQPDGFWFDTMGALGPCFCPNCRKAFRDAHGLEIPVTPEDSNQPLYGAFRHKRGMALLKDMGDFILSRSPRAQVGFNQVGSPPFPEIMPPSINRLTLDPPTQAQQSRTISFCAAYGSMADRPAEVMPTIFNQGWGDWSPATPERLEQMVAAAWSRGVRTYMGDRLRPDGRLDAASVRAMKAVADARRWMAAEFPPEDAKLDDEVVVLHARSVPYGEDMRFFATDTRARRGAVEAAFRLACDAGAAATVVGEGFLPDRLSRAGLVVLPQLPAIEPETEAILKRFVMDGGKVLVVGNVPRVKGQPIQWLGVRRAEKPWQDHIYLPPWPETAGALPALVRGEFRVLELDGAEKVLPAIAPYDLAHGVCMGWGVGPASDEPSPHAAVTRRSVGRGEAWYVEAPLFSDYRAGGNWQHIEWLRGALQRILPAPRARLRGAAGNVELVMWRNAASTWAVLLNHGGEEHFGEAGRLTWPRTLGPLPAYRVTLEVCDARMPERVTCGGEECWFERDGNTLSTPVILDAAWKVVRVDWR